MPISLLVASPDDRFRETIRDSLVNIDGANRTFAATLTSGKPMTITLGEQQHQVSTIAPLIVALSKR